MFTQLVPMSEGSVGGIGVVLPPIYEIFWSALIAQAEAHQIREDARAQAQQIVAQARLDAQVEAQRVQDAAQRQILAERQAAQISLRSDVGLLASELAEKLVGEHLENTDLTARVVDRFLDELEAEEVPVGGVN